MKSLYKLTKANVFISLILSLIMFGSFIVLTNMTITSSLNEEFLMVLADLAFFVESVYLLTFAIWGWKLIDLYIGRFTKEEKEKLIKKNKSGKFKKIIIMDVITIGSLLCIAAIYCGINGLKENFEDAIWIIMGIFSIFCMIIVIPKSGGKC